MNDIIREMKQTLSSWLVGMELVGLQCESVFILYFQRPEDVAGLPYSLNLCLYSEVRIGQAKYWTNFLESMPKKPKRGEPDYPALAYMFMLLVGSKVTEVTLNDDSSLEIKTSDDETINISGANEFFDISWDLTEPEDIKGDQAKFITCDAGRALVINA